MTKRVAHEVLMNVLMSTAYWLGDYVDMEWSADHESDYNLFFDKLVNLYKLGQITEEDFRKVANIAFYDWYYEF